jgi:hypothetical protein
MAGDDRHDFAAGGDKGMRVMTIVHRFAMVAAFALICITGLIAQTNDSKNGGSTAQICVLVQQRFQFDKTTESGKALAAAARACANL